MAKEKVYEIVIKVDEAAMKLFKDAYDNYCDVMEVDDESFEHYLGSKLVEEFRPKKPNEREIMKDKIVEIVRKNPGITPKEVHKKLNEDG